MNFSLAQCMGLVLRASTFGGIFKQPSVHGVNADFAPMLALLPVETVAQATSVAIALRFFLHDLARVSLGRDGAPRSC